MTPDKHTYHVRWAEEDQEYVAICDQFPSLSWLADTQSGALQGIVELVAEAEADIASTGEAYVPPKNVVYTVDYCDEYVGTFVQSLWTEKSVADKVADRENAKQSRAGSYGVRCWTVDEEDGESDAH